jgi:hypothetical protein
LKRDLVLDDFDLVDEDDFEDDFKDDFEDDFFVDELNKLLKKDLLLCFL